MNTDKGIQTHTQKSREDVSLAFPYAHQVRGTVKVSTQAIDVQLLQQHPQLHAAQHPKHAEVGGLLASSAYLTCVLLPAASFETSYASECLLWSKVHDAHHKSKQAEAGAHMRSRHHHGGVYARDAVGGARDQDVAYTFRVASAQVNLWRLAPSDGEHVYAHSLSKEHVAAACAGGRGAPILQGSSADTHHGSRGELHQRNGANMHDKNSCDSQGRDRSQPSSNSNSNSPCNTRGSGRDCAGCLGDLLLVAYGGLTFDCRLSQVRDGKSKDGYGKSVDGNINVHPIGLACTHASPAALMALASVWGTLFAKIGDVTQRAEKKSKAAWALLLDLALPHVSAAL
jgi:hypothetical protein